MNYVTYPGMLWRCYLYFYSVTVEVKLMKNKTCRLHSEKKKDRSRFQRNFEIRDLSVIFEILVNNFKIICVNFQTTENM